MVNDLVLVLCLGTFWAWANFDPCVCACACAYACVKFALVLVLVLSIVLASLVERTLYAYAYALVETSILRRLNTVIARGITRSTEGSRDSARGLKSKQTWRREAYFLKLCFRQV